jgi:hypothetical protein
MSMTEQELYDYIHEHLTYHEDGFLMWKKRPAGTTKIKIGQIAGSRRKSVNSNSDIRSVIRHKGRAYLVHRLIFLYHHKYLPELIDHIDNNLENNRIENLRPATKSQNAMNSKIDKRNKSGIKGLSVRTIKQKGKNGIIREHQYLRASIAFQSNTAIILGEESFYPTIAITKNFKMSERDDAIHWIQEKREQIHGEYARHK